MSVTQRRLFELFEYDRTTGRLVRTNPGHGARAVTEARSKQGYLIRYVDGKLYTEHKLVYLYHYGYIPDEIDHVNRIKDDNRIENLRECIRTQNNGNHGIRKDNSSGYRGVSRHTQTGRWYAQLTYKGVHYSLGLHDTPEKAALAYNEAAKRYFGEFAKLNEVSAR